MGVDRAVGEPTGWVKFQSITVVPGVGLVALDVQGFLWYNGVTLKDAGNWERAPHPTF